MSNSNGCIVSRSMLVLPSEPTIIKEVLITDNSHKDRLSVAIVIDESTQGDYQYAIDINLLDLNNEANYQDENYFTDILYGKHIVYVRDKNGCGIVQKEVLFIDYPKFLTPNGDGKFDTWNLDNINRISADFKTISNINIFDRYGKVVATINPKGLGWDGTFKGQEVPASDYWFSVKLLGNNGRTTTKKGHFSLKRFM